MELERRQADGGEEDKSASAQVRNKAMRIHALIPRVRPRPEVGRKRAGELSTHTRPGSRPSFSTLMPCGPTSNASSITQASKLDYVNNPGAAKDFNESEVANAAAAAGPKSKQVDALTKRLREQQKKLKDGSARAMKPSVEGRNIVLMK
mgnify:CR=1 FL=1